MKALSSGFATLTFVLLLLSTCLLQIGAWKSPHDKTHWDATQNERTKGHMKLKYAKTGYASYSASSSSNSQSMVVSRPPSLNLGFPYGAQPRPGNVNNFPVSQDGAGVPPMAKTFVDEHNKVRDVYGVPPLTWNSQLIPSAQRLAAACAFRHTDNNPYGENIAAGQSSPEEVVSQWVEGPQEKLAYDPNNPQDSHFTQVVWEATRELGCAVTSCPRMVGVSLPQSPIQFWVCEYHPAGNVETLYLKNVHAQAGGAPSRR